MESTSTDQRMSTHAWGLRLSITPTDGAWKRALAEIQSRELDHGLNVVSGFQAFFKSASREPSVRSLYSAMLVSGEVREAVLGQLHDLSALDIDRRYANPNDTAIAVLLWLTYFAAPEHQQVAADLVDRLAPQCWYAKKLARWVLAPPSATSGNTKGAPSGFEYLNTTCFPGATQLFWNTIAQVREHSHVESADTKSAGDPGKAELFKVPG